jgi:hypothetical protein
MRDWRRAWREALTPRVELAGDTPAEPVVRALLDWAVGRGKSSLE